MTVWGMVMVLRVVAFEVVTDADGEEGKLYAIVGARRAVAGGGGTHQSAPPERFRPLKLEKGRKERRRRWLRR